MKELDELNGGDIPIPPFDLLTFYTMRTMARGLASPVISASMTPEFKAQSVETLVRGTHLLQPAIEIPEHYSSALEIANSMVGLPDSELYQLGIQFLETNFGRIADKMEQMNASGIWLSRDTRQSLGAITNLAASSDETLADVSIALFQKTAAGITDALIHGKVKPMDIEKPLGSNNEDVAITAITTLFSAINRPDLSVGGRQQAHIQMIMPLAESGNKQVLTIVQHSLRTILPYFEVPTVPFVEAWLFSDQSWLFQVKEGDQYSMIERNLETMRQLDQARPGGVKLLYERFGLKIFARYPLELLIKQIDEADDASKPYGIVLYANDDWSGALYYGSHIYSNLVKQLHGKYYLRFIEANSRANLARVLLELDQSYGSQNKIAFGVVNAHGGEDNIGLGDSGRGQIVFSKDLQSKRAQALKRFFTPDATIVIDACKTGTEGGFAQHMAEATGLQVIAPAANTYLTDLKAELEGSGINFNAIYKTKNAAREYDPER